MKLNFPPLCYDIKDAFKNLVDIMSEPKGINAPDFWQINWQEIQFQGRKPCLFGEMCEFSSYLGYVCTKTIYQGIFLINT